MDTTLNEEEVMVRDSARKFLEAECPTTLVRAMGDTPLHVTTTPAFAVRWLAPRLGRLWQELPDLDLRLHEVAWTTDVDPGTSQADLVVRVGAASGAGLVSVPLMAGNVTPMCSPRLLGDGPVIERPDDLLNYRLLHSHSYAPWQDWFSRSGVSNVDVAHGPIFDDTNLAYTAALAGQGVGLLHTALTTEETAAGQLVQPFESGPLDEMSYYIVYLATSSNESRIAGFRDWLIASVKP
jgi:DNA-binding transcriptional LysR family regulator